MSLEPSLVSTWEALCREFIKHYKDNSNTEITMRDLEMMRQEANETISAFITRWKYKANQMMTKPDEATQVQIMQRNLLPAYTQKIGYHYFTDFRALQYAGIKVEDDLARARIENPKERKSDESRSLAAHPINEISASITAFQGPKRNKTGQSKMSAQKPKRTFTELGAPPSSVLRELQECNLLQPRQPGPPPNPLPRNWDANAHCDFHQGPGHVTDDCFALKHAIQDLIDQNIIAPPIKTNP